MSPTIHRSGERTSTSADRADDLVTRRSVIGAPQPDSTPAPPASPAAASVADERPRMSVVVVEDVAALEAYAQEWQDLASAALEPNVFYEPWLLLPALRAFGASDRLQFVLVLAADPARPSQPPLLCGLFPLERRNHFEGLSRKLPFKTLRFWRKPEITYLCTPLLRADVAREALAAFFDWLAAGSHGCSLLEFNFVSGEGPFHRLLIDHCNEHQTLTCVTHTFTRALLRPADDAETFIRAAVRPGRLRELRRHERRLADAGPLAYRTLEPGDDVDAWIEEFLNVEAISWKGKGGRALVRDESEQAFFREVAREAFRRGQLMMLALRLNGRTIAHKCNFLSGSGSFAFKIAFDEEHARHSPGVLLELENIRRLHARPEIAWMDSCAAETHPMLDRLWPERRAIENLVIGTGTSPGGLVVAAIPLLKWLNRRFYQRVSPRD